MYAVFASGRRDFGEFSVYNPTNKAPAANTWTDSPSAVEYQQWK
jgi:hypothetical protein